MAEIRSVGIPSPRVEGEEKVGGQALYAVDVVLPNILWIKVLRSPIAHGKIKRIDITEAQRLPEVEAVLTGQDIAGVRIGKKIVDIPLLADGVVRYIGEKVAAVAAETEEAAERAVDLIDVEYEELEALLDPLEALKPSAPLLHPDLLSYRGLPNKLEAPSNAYIQMSWGKGDIQAGFQQADVIVENIFHTQLVHQAYIEPHSCVAKADLSGGAEIWSCSKT